MSDIYIKQITISFTIEQSRFHLASTAIADFTWDCRRYWKKCIVLSDYHGNKVVKSNLAVVSILQLTCTVNCN